MAYTSASRKAQALSYDFFIALAVFFVILILFTNYWYYSMVQIQEIEEKNRAVNALFLASEVWFKEGYPKYWRVEDVSELGVSNENRINKTKMEMLPQLGYQKLIYLLNLGTFNLQYSVYDTGNNIIFQFPADSGSSTQNVLLIERIGVLEDRPVKIRTMIWD